MKQRMRSLLTGFLFAVLVVSRLAAQDARIVVEPFFPPLCTTVDAQLHSNGHALAAADERKLDTARIQKAIDKCGKGRAVRLHINEQNDAFLTGPLTMKSEVALILDRGVTLYASRDATLYARSAGSCGVVNEAPEGCKPLIAFDHASGAAIMGDGTIDGRGGDKILGAEFSWWDLAEQARKGGRQQVPRLIVSNDSNNITLYRIRLRNSANFHVVFNRGDGLTVWGIRIDTPKRGARNTDGIDPGNGARNVTITRSYIRTGDDDVAIKGGPGGAVNMTISHDRFYYGHGMSIGSETNGGVSHIRVTDLSLDGPDNGIRIKSNGSRGGLTEDVVYEDVCVRNSPNPITLDTAYGDAGPVTGSLMPTMKNIVLANVRISGGGKVTFNGYDREHRIEAQLNGVAITDDGKYSYVLNHADLKQAATNLELPAGTDSTVAGKTAPGSPVSCAEKFVAFPE